MGRVVTPLQIDIERGKNRGLSALRSDILNHHSSWAALCLCLKVRPDSLRKLLEAAGVTHGQVGPFDACADGYSVYEDGRMRGKVAT
jgi:hypothetical protein